MLSKNQILFGNKMLQEVAISWDVPILKAARILAGKEINEFWKWINADEFLNYQLNETQDLFKEEKKQYAEDCKNHEKPWELWQAAIKTQEGLDWDDCTQPLPWHKYCAYRRKQTTFVPEYYSGLNWKDAEHLVGKIIEYSDFPGKGWKVGKLKKLNKIDENFVVNTKKHCVFSTYIRTLSKHPTIHIGGVELPMPETVAPVNGTKYWIFPYPANRKLFDSFYWTGAPSVINTLQAGKVHLTEDRAQAWANWWKTTVIDKMI